MARSVRNIQAYLEWHLDRYLKNVAKMCVKREKKNAVEKGRFFTGDDIAPS